MIPSDLIAKIRKLEIRTKGLVNHLFSGEYHSAFKGRGMVFSEVRPYQYGDDVRQIDWNVTARTGDPHIKVFEEEREQTLMLVVDISPSGRFGSRRRKLDLITELCAVLAFSAVRNQDKVGLLLFSDRIEHVVPPRKGRSHVLRLIRDLYAVQPAGTGTDIAGALGYANRILNRRSIFILASDFQAPDFDHALRVTNRKHDLVTLHLYDPLERTLPDMGIVPLRDPETGRSITVDTSSAAFRNAFSRQQEAAFAALQDRFRRQRIDSIALGTHESYIDPLRQFFLRRANRP